MHDRSLCDMTKNPVSTCKIPASCNDFLHYAKIYSSAITAALGQHIAPNEDEECGECQKCDLLQCNKQPPSNMLAKQVSKCFTS